MAGRLVSVTRIDAPQVADERTMLLGWLAFHRETLRTKCEGLTDEQLKRRAVPPSSMSLLGMVRHYAEVEHYWWRQVVGQQPTLLALYCSEEHPDGDFDLVDEADVAEAFTTWDAEVAYGDQVLASLSLDEVVPDEGGQMSIRWLVVHLIEEYARHNGHADFLREVIDGATGV
jgi:hypothetical protein